MTEGALYKGTAGTSLQVSDLKLVTSPLVKSAILSKIGSALFTACIAKSCFGP